MMSSCPLGGYPQSRASGRGTRAARPGSLDATAQRLRAATSLGLCPSCPSRDHPLDTANRDSARQLATAGVRHRTYAARRSNAIRLGRGRSCTCGPECSPEWLGCATGARSRWAERPEPARPGLVTSRRQSSSRLRSHPTHGAAICRRHEVSARQSPTASSRCRCSTGDRGHGTGLSRPSAGPSGRDLGHTASRVFSRRADR